MSAPPSRASEYRKRAAAYGAKAATLSGDLKTDAMVKEQALLQLARLEEWIAPPAHVPSKHDYKLQPVDTKSIASPPRHGKKRGRQPRPREIAT